jgi:hypothetical protein
VPPIENKKIYENSVPAMSACAATFNNANDTNTPVGRGNASNNGIFANPNRKNGTGLGIRYSRVAKNKQKAPNTAMLAVLGGDEILPYAGVD